MRCAKASPLDKAWCINALEGAKRKQQDKQENTQEIRNEVQLPQEKVNDHYDDDVVVIGDEKIS